MIEAPKRAAMAMWRAYMKDEDGDEAMNGSCYRAPGGGQRERERVNSAEEVMAGGRFAS